MNRIPLLIINFNSKGGIEQFSSSLVERLDKKKVDYIYLKNQSLTSIIKHVKIADEVLFCSNNKKIYLLKIFFRSKKFSIILHDHKIRTGSSIREKISLYFFNLYKNKFHKIIIHSAQKKLVSMPNVSLLKMPLHGQISSYQNKIKLLAFGRIDKYKNLLALCEACSLCPNIHLTIVGSGNVDIKLNKLIIENENIEIFNNYVSDLIRDSLFAKADYLVLAYKSTTQTGLVDLACYHNLPQILTDIPEFKIYKNYKTCVFLDGPRKEQLFDGINNIPNIGSNSYLSMKQACAHITKNQSFDWDIYCKKVLE